jgi:chemotaxis protein histidine kinase CheA
MNADLRIETEPGLGTRITLTVPLPMAGTNAQTAIEASPQ